MAFIPVANTIELAFRGQCAGNQVVNTMSFESTAGAIDVSGQAALVTALVPWYVTYVVSLLSVDYTYAGCASRNLTTQAGVVLFDATSVATAGGQTGARLPMKDAVHINFITGLAGRSFRGGNYIGPLSEGSTTGDAADATWLGYLAAAYNASLAAAIPSPFQQVVVSRYNNLVPRVTGVTTPVIGRVIVSNLIASQRRRKPGVGA
jgi:hypothetical protein